MYNRDERHAGSTGYTYMKIIRIALVGITGFYIPMKIATIAGYFVCGFTFLISLYALYAQFISKDYVPG